MTVKKAISVLLATAIAFAACQASQAAKREAKPDLDGCIAEARAWNITLKHDIAGFMGVSLERMPALFCERLAAGVRSGRITYSDVNNLQLDQPTEIWMVLKGKPKPAAVTKTPAPRTSNFRNCTGRDGIFQVPASRKCPPGGYGHFEQPSQREIKARSSVATSAPRNARFHTCSNVFTGTFEVPASRKCPLGGG